MLRTVGVLAVGMLLSVVVLGSLVWVTVTTLPWSARIYALYVGEALTGAAVGSFVGFLQKRRAGVVALVCLLPPAYLQYVNRLSKPATGFRLVLLLMGTAVELGIAFSIAHRLSKSRRTVNEISMPR
jgi:hypothetical protein